MSIAGHRRRLDRLRPVRMTEGNALLAEFDEMQKAAVAWAREQEAAMALANFARALAGTDEAARLQRIASSPPQQPSTHAAPAPLPGPSRPKGDGRPGPHDILTVDQVMRVPWLDCTASVVPLPPPPADPGRPRDPWENWGFVRPPSYDGEGEVEPE